MISDMSKAARSIFVFGIYVMILGILLVAVPNLLLGLFAIPHTSEVWIRILGMLLLFLGFYYHQAARRELRDFFRWTVYGRSSVIVFFTVFVVADLAPPSLLMLALIDLLGAAWTALALHSSE